MADCYRCGEPLGLGFVKEPEGLMHYRCSDREEPVCECNGTGYVYSDYFEANMPCPVCEPLEKV